MTKSKLKLILHAVFILLLLFSLAALATTLSGKALILEVIGITILLALSMAGLVMYARLGGRVFLFVYLLSFINLGLWWYFFDELYGVLLALGLAGFVMALPYRKRKQKDEEPHSVVFDVVPEVKKSEVKKLSEVKKSDEKPRVQHSPGKYVASKNSNNYHEPKCDWALKIKSERQTWFKSKEDAWEKGYKAHGCVK